MTNKPSNPFEQFDQDPVERMPHRKTPLQQAMALIAMLFMALGGFLVILSMFYGLLTAYCWDWVVGECVCSGIG